MTSLPNNVTKIRMLKSNLRCITITNASGEHNYDETWSKSEIVPDVFARVTIPVPATAKSVSYRRPSDAPVSRCVKRSEVGRTEPRRRSRHLMGDVYDQLVIRLGARSRGRPDDNLWCDTWIIGSIILIIIIISFSITALLAAAAAAVRRYVASKQHVKTLHQVHANTLRYW